MKEEEERMFSMDSYFISLHVLIVMAFFFSAATAGNFNQEVNITWGGGRGRILNGGQDLSLSMDNASGSGFESLKQYLYARFDVQLKLVSGNSAGTVTTFFVSSQGSGHDEIDYEFLGNVSGQPYTIHTNVFVNGEGNREQQFRPWFDPTNEFHSYTILWNPLRIIFMVDDTPIRVFNNNVQNGVPFPTSRPMKMYASLWNGEEWATQGGRVKTDWTQAPFTATYRNYKAVGCVVSGFAISCNGDLSGQPWQTQGLDADGRNRIQSVQQNYMIYDYCADLERFPGGLPKECKLPRF